MHFKYRKLFIFLATISIIITTYYYCNVIMVIDKQTVASKHSALNTLLPNTEAKNNTLITVLNTSNHINYQTFFFFCNNSLLVFKKKTKHISYRTQYRIQCYQIYQMSVSFNPTWRKIFIWTSFLTSWKRTWTSCFAFCLTFSRYYPCYAFCVFF